MLISYIYITPQSIENISPLPPPSPDLLDACESGDLAVVEELLQHLPEAVNEFLFDGENLLMR